MQTRESLHISGFINHAWQGCGIKYLLGEIEIQINLSGRQSASCPSLTPRTLLRYLSWVNKKENKKGLRGWWWWYGGGWRCQQTWLMWYWCSSLCILSSFSAGILLMIFIIGFSVSVQEINDQCQYYISGKRYLLWLKLLPESFLLCLKWNRLKPLNHQLNLV